MRRSTFNKNKAVADDDEDDQEEEDDDGEEESEEEEEESIENKKRTRPMNNVNFSQSKGSSSSSPSCQAENCPADMTEAKRYHRRHKVCEYHAKAPMVRVGGLWQRFCQQCSRFHELAEFDETKRSCRRRLAGHNERRRKSSYDLHGEGSNLNNE